MITVNTAVSLMNNMQSNLYVSPGFQKDLTDVNFKAKTEVKRTIL